LTASPFTQQLQSLLGGGSAALFEALQGSPPVSIRLNRAKKVLPGYDLTHRVPWCASGCYLEQRPLFTLDPLLHGGAYYVQEAASMFLSQMALQLLQAEALKVLDLCAAPGGKTTLLADFLPQGSLLVANEAIRSRTGVLAENVSKWGNPCVLVTRNDPKDFAQLPGFFDAIFVDAPCSGEGLFRKDKNAAGEWSKSGVQLCRERQRRIVADAWPALKTGGYLIYSTCTFNVRENEENVLWIMNELGADSVKIEAQKEWGVTLASELGLNLPAEVHAYRFFPHKALGEGFFAAALQKKSEAGRNPLSRKKSRAAEEKASVPREVRQWILHPDSFTFACKENKIRAIPVHTCRCSHLLSRALNVVQEGVPVATIKGKDYAPCAALALSVALNPAAFPAVDLDLRSAQQFLKKESIAGAPQHRGIELVRYSGLPLGFVKNLGARSNNLYPQEWKIRMSLPQT
jgi:16S rRNA C967 or C1407 C5-methylase (RsmB/RsmF family)/NOL1/NOP2/fmu family ribosome biogenesis protein